jgi:ABC-type lipoprotein release transport system permease subunit
MAASCATGGRRRRGEENARHHQRDAADRAALFASFNGRVEFALVRGMRVEDIRSNPRSRARKCIGSFNRLKPGSEQIAIGSRLAESLGATIGSEITIINPAGRRDAVRHDVCGS